MTTATDVRQLSRDLWVAITFRHGNQQCFYGSTEAEALRRVIVG